LWRSGVAGVFVAVAVAMGTASTVLAATPGSGADTVLAAPPDSLSPAIGLVDSVRMAADSTLAPARPVRRPRPVSSAPT
jgi:hypothetical protein